MLSKSSYDRYAERDVPVEWESLWEAAEAQLFFTWNRALVRLHAEKGAQQHGFAGAI